MGRCGSNVALFAVGAGLLLSLPPLASLAPPGPPPPGDTHPTAPGGLSPNLTIEPVDWWIVGGSSTSVSATWTSIPPGCTATPQWFRWSVAPGGAEGWVAPTNRSVVNFTAGGIDSGTTGLEVASAASVRCGPNSTSVFRTASATFRVDAPLEIEEVRTDGPVARAPQPVELRGTLVGGDPPFSLTVDWGNGNITTATDPVGGNFSVRGDPGSGPLHPEVFATDAAGLVARAAAEENGSRNGPLSIAIDPSTYIAEVGVPVEFTLEGSEPADAYSQISVCEEVGSLRPEPRADPGAGFSCVFATPGLANISVLAVSNSAPFAAATAELREPVVPDLSVATDPTLPNAEVGRETYVPVVLTGGVPPFLVHWRFVGNGTLASAIVYRDGTFFAAITPAIAGSEQVEVGAVDSLGLPAANSSTVVEVEGSLSGQSSGRGIAAPGGTGVELSGAAVAGAPPFDWTVLPSSDLASESAAGGTLASVGAFAWNGTLRAEGTQTVRLVLVDSLGAVWNATFSFTAVPTLTIVFAATPDGAERWTGSVTILGGVSPFDLRINGSDGESWNRTGLVQRNSNLSEPTAAQGNLSLSVTVTDRLGITARSSAWVHVRPAAPAPSAPLGSLPVAVGGLVALAGGAAYWWRRRTKGKAATSDPDPVSVLRAIIAPSDGADRATVELLAEEQGVPADLVGRTIDRLVADGTLRAERGPDGEEVLAWRPDR